MTDGLARAVSSALLHRFLTILIQRCTAMNDNHHECLENGDAVDISIWENEGGALDRCDMNHHYGRRIEPDGSWTVYHVFTGAPADMGSRPMGGLSKTDATTRVIMLNAHNAKRRKAASDRYAVLPV
jgi:hypothetical protein